MVRSAYGWRVYSAANLTVVEAVGALSSLLRDSLMSRRGYLRVFLISLVAGIAVPWVAIWIRHLLRPPTPDIWGVTGKVGISQQISVGQVSLVREMGYQGLVALRPDGEG